MATAAGTNWAGNLTYSATAVHRPETVVALQELVARTPRLRPIGTRHSFNGIADTTAEHVSLERLNRIVALDRAARTVTLEAGVRYGELGRFLHREGFALPNLASLPHISVAGAVATATHGSGDAIGNLATAVEALEVVTAAGEIATFSRLETPDVFPGAVVHLGALGVVTQLTLALEPTYDVRQRLFENLSLVACAEHFDAITAAASSVSLFTDWRGEHFHQVWLKQRCDRPASPLFEGDAVFGAPAATADCHPIPGHAPECCTPQLGVAGPWYERLPHFRLEFTPSSGAELQSEFFVPRGHAVAALRELFAMREQLAPHVLVSEVRTIAADDLWLSPCHGRASVGLHFTWRPDGPAVRALLPQVETALAPFDARPHWAKLFTMPAERIRSLYPKFQDFADLRQRCDPERKFGNAYLDALFA